MGIFETVDDSTIRNGGCTDIYFPRCEEILKKEGINPAVVMEVTAPSLPDPWGIFCGLADVINLLERLPVTVDAMPEGTLFHENEPVLRIAGRYRDFCRFETAILGFLCHSSGIASAAAHITIAASGKPVFSFGSRRQHPAIATMIERSAWIGGVDGVSNTSAPAGIPVVGTMPHAFVMCYDSPEAAWRSFDANAPKNIPRVMLCDTYCDEKTESLKGAGCGATSVRLDTPRSRRGNMKAIIDEVRWELDAHDYPDVRIFLSGGVTRDDIIAYRDCVDAFGVGGAIANAQVIDFGMDIVEKEGLPLAKRGKRSGVKQVYLFPDGRRCMMPEGTGAPEGSRPLLERFIEKGRVVKRPKTGDARKLAQSQISLLPAGSCSCVADVFRQGR
ncbi:MAG TPA: nicotinate phosphoribosyltransferase [Methanoregulaceae archaeon]|nr:nicotinate phosphoribosyltransferase [Methanoregulaceae archaeon]